MAVRAMTPEVSPTPLLKSPFRSARSMAASAPLQSPHRHKACTAAVYVCPLAHPFPSSSARAERVPDKSRRRAYSAIFWFNVTSSSRTTGCHAVFPFPSPFACDTQDTPLGRPNFWTPADVAVIFDPCLQCSLLQTTSPLRGSTPATSAAATVPMVFAAAQAPGTAVATPARAASALLANNRCFISIKRCMRAVLAPSSKPDSMVAAANLALLLRSSPPRQKLLPRPPNSKPSLPTRLPLFSYLPLSACLSTPLPLPLRFAAFSDNSLVFLTLLAIQLLNCSFEDDFLVCLPSLLRYLSRQDGAGMVVSVKNIEAMGTNARFGP
mmetsp:Transcript_102091/g.257205  ORF Transcript_102091/g.257205 Transcript_102091/m.257205 type:complete len:324 (+) Transcript_102091:1464-2435(+)